MVNAQCLTTMMTSSRQSLGQDMGLWLDWLVGLDFFKDDTRPSGHISRPT